jgi:hypothetical protein
MAAANPEAQTAFGPMVLSAIEQQEPVDRRLVDDHLAAAFLPGALRLLVVATRWKPLRDTIIRASEHIGPGLWANHAWAGSSQRRNTDGLCEVSRAANRSAGHRSWSTMRGRWLSSCSTASR